MAGFVTDTDVMRQIAGQMEQANQDINSTMSALLGQLEPLAAGWKGPASAAFNSAQMRWNEVAKKHNVLLADISQALGQGSQNYATNDETNQQAFTKIGGALNA